MISEAYRAEQTALHAKGNYGTASLGFGKPVSSLIRNTGAKSILDYGCGSMQNLQKVLETDWPVEYTGYDPAIPELSEPGEPADLVCCIDVLEHIEPEHLNAVLSDLKRCTVKHGFFTVHTGPAVKTLSDGRNAHLIQEPCRWWFYKLSDYFDILTYQKLPNGGFFVVGP